MIENDVNAFLEHHGVKGMHWGFRKEYEPTGRKSGKNVGSGSKELTPQEKNVVNKLAPHGYSEPRMRALFGPSDFHFTEKEKSALKDVGVAAVIAGGVYALSKYGEHTQLKGLLGDNPSKSLEEFWKTQQGEALQRSKKGFSPKFIENLSNEDISLKAGSIFTRISSKKEQAVKMDGFYAAYKKEDVDRYKAILPIYWKAWGISNPDGAGYMVHIKANQDVKAPSPKKTYNMLKSLFDERVPGDPVYVRGHLKKQYGSKLSDDELLQKIAHTWALNWADSTNPLTKIFFAKVKAAGYNAVPDLNDAGALADSPLRLLNGNIFSISGHTRLSRSAIDAAQKSVLAIAHAIVKGFLDMIINEKDYVKHDVGGLSNAVSTNNEQKPDISVVSNSVVGSLVRGHKFVTTHRAMKRKKKNLGQGKHDAGQKVVNGLVTNFNSKPPFKEV